MGAAVCASASDKIIRLRKGPLAGALPDMAVSDQEEWKVTVEEIVAKALGAEVSEITDETGPLSDERWTSMKQIVILSGLEQAFSVHFAMKEIRRLTSVGAIKEVLAGKGI